MAMHFLDTLRANRLTLHQRIPGSAFIIVTILFNAHVSMCLPQVPPALANNQREDIPPPDGGVPEPGRIQDDLHHIDVAYQGYHPQILAVSNFHLYAAGPSFINDTREIGSSIRIS